METNALLALSDQVTITLINSVIALFSAVFTGVMAYLMARLNAKSDLAAVKTEEVKVALVEATATSMAKQDETLKMASATHVLVNSNFAVQLKLNAELSRWKADQTDEPADREAAGAAERLYLEHEEKQRKVDEMKSIGQV